MKAVLNATPLIYLAKTGLHRIVKDLGLELITTSQVVEEVLLPGFPEYLELKELLKNVRMQGVTIIKKFQHDELGKGEASALSLAKETGLAIITDDKVARAYAEVEGIDVFHTTFFLFRAVEKKALTKTEAIAYLDKLILAGWRCDIETYVRIKNRIEA